MCHNRTNNNKIDRLHERCLRLIYNDKKSSFEDLLEKDGSVPIHHRNLRTLRSLKSSYFCRSFSCKATKLIQYEQLLIFCHTLCQNGQPWIRKFVIHRFKTEGQYTIPHDESINEYKHVIKT